MASKLPTLNRGTSYDIGVLYKENGVPASIVGSTIFFTAKTDEFDDDLTDAAAVLSKTITDHSDPTHGASLIHFDPVDSESIEPGKYHYDIKITLADGRRFKLDEGILPIDGSPTNRLS